MLDFIKQNKLISGVAILLLLGVGYYVFFAGGGSTATLSETTPGGTSPVSQQLLVTLSNLHSIELSNALFSDPVFTSLSDFGVTIPQEPVGRRNPFLPYSGSTATTGTTSPLKPLNAY